MANQRRRDGRIFARAPQTEVEDELAFHMERRVQDYIARGLSETEAREAARQRFGDLDDVRAVCADMLDADRRAAVRRDWFDDLHQDLKFGIRGAMRAPMFAVMAVLTLALGIGANAAVFGVVKSVLLDPLPYGDGGRLVRVYGRMLDGTMDRSSVSPGAYSDLAARNRSFERMAAFFHSTFDVTYAAASGPRVLEGALTAPGYFEALNVQPVLGRTFTEHDATSEAAVAMLSHEAWQREFSGARDILGRTLSLDSEPYVIIGVLPQGFVGTMGKSDLFFTLDVAASLRDPVGARKSHWLGVIGRLKPGVTVESAQREMAAIGDDLAREHPDSDKGMSFTVLSLRDAMAGDTRTPLLVLMASAALVLVITCANLAGALLSRMLSRRKEFAVRVALGAGRGRLVRQLLTESTVLAVAGGTAGLLLAMLGLAVLRELAPPTLPDYAALTLDPVAVLVTFALALCTGLAFGVAPAFSVGRSSPQGTLRDETRGTSEGLRMRYLRGALVAGQIALSLSLLAGAALLTRSLLAITSTPIGYDPEGVLSVSTKGPLGVSDDARRRFFEELEQRVATLPGVSAVATTSELPGPNMNRNGLAIEGVTWPNEGVQPFIPQSTVSDDYFRTLGIPLREGRTFGAEDRLDSTPAIVISETMARMYWPRGNALGARIRLGPHDGWAQVVGIVGDVRRDPAVTEPEPMAYGSSRQDRLRSSRVYLVRTAGDPLALVRPFQAQLAAVDPATPLTDVLTLEDFLADGLVGRRLPVLLMSAFGVLALVLASVGVYAMFAAMAAAREREFGVRVALGSSPREIAALVLRQGALWLGLGLAGGALGVIVISRMLRTLLFGVSQFDPVALGMAALMLIACAAAALLVPVRRAARVDPISVLR